MTMWASSAYAQQQPQGFAVERFYLSAPGAGWFIMDDLNMAGGLGGAIALTSGYSRNPLVVHSPDGRQSLVVVSDQVFADVGVAGVYDRYRVYLNFPMPFRVTGSSGGVGPYEWAAPAVSLGTNPDTIAEPRIGFDVRLLGEPGGAMRLGASAQLIFPSGERSDYTTDGTYRGMIRFLAAGDRGRFAYAGQVGVHIRPLNESPIPDTPRGSELLFGIAAGRKVAVTHSWAAIVGPEIYGETALNSFSGEQTALESLLTGRLERNGAGPHLRIKAGVGHGIVQHFGAPEWRAVFGIELFNQR
jgi:hypothetical protein